MSDLVVRPLSHEEAMAAYDELLVEAFPEDELLPRAQFDRLLSGPNADVLGVLDERQLLLGVAVGEHPPEFAGVVLLSWLAVGDRARGLGVGSRLVRAACARWLARDDASLVVAEVEDPRHHRALDPRLGDPQARAMFYDRLGARALDLPYFQPALSEGGRRVEHLLLTVLGPQPVPDAVETDLLRPFLRAYVGPPGEGEDRSWHRLFDALDGATDSAVRTGRLPGPSQTG